MSDTKQPSAHNDQQRQVSRRTRKTRPDAVDAPRVIQLFDRTPISSKASEKRRNTRFECDGTPCNLGHVMDLSLTGIKVRCSAKSEIELDTKEWLAITNESGEIRVDTIVRRIERVNKKEIDVALEFINITDEARQALYNVGQNHPSIKQRGIEGC